MRRTVPSLHRDRSRLPFIPHDGGRAPQAVRMSTMRAVFHVQRHLTAAGGRSPSFQKLQPLCLCPGQDRSLVPGIKYITFPRRVNIGKRSEQHFLCSKYSFFQHGQVCCTSFGRVEWENHYFLSSVSRFLFFSMTLMFSSFSSVGSSSLSSSGSNDLMSETKGEKSPSTSPGKQPFTPEAIS